MYPQRAQKSFSGNLQGNRVLFLGKTSEELLESGLIPAAEFAFAANAPFEGSVSLQDIEC